MKFRRSVADHYRISLWGGDGHWAQTNRTPVPFCCIGRRSTTSWIPNTGRSIMPTKKEYKRAPAKARKKPQKPAAKKRPRTRCRQRPLHATRSYASARCAFSLPDSRRGRIVGRAHVSREGKDLRHVRVAGEPPWRRSASGLDHVRPHRARSGGACQTGSLFQAALCWTKWLDRRMARQESAVGRDRGTGSRRVAPARAQTSRRASRRVAGRGKREAGRELTRHPDRSEGSAVEQRCYNGVTQQQIPRSLRSLVMTRRRNGLVMTPRRRGLPRHDRNAKTRGMPTIASR